MQYCTLSVFRQVHTRITSMPYTFSITLSRAKQVKMKTTQCQFEYNDTISSGEKVQLIEGRDVGDRQLKETVHCAFQFINIVRCHVTTSVKFCSALFFYVQIYIVPLHCSAAQLNLHKYCVHLHSPLV